jgi:hypothetical protein
VALPGRALPKVHILVPAVPQHSTVAALVLGDTRPEPEVKLPARVHPPIGWLASPPCRNGSSERPSHCRESGAAAAGSSTSSSTMQMIVDVRIKIGDSVPAAGICGGPRVGDDEWDGCDRTDPNIPARSSTPTRDINQRACTIELESQAGVLDHAF